MIGIYKITNKLNGKIYIGKSVDIKHRFIEYKTPKYAERNLVISRAIKKYGIENFEFEIVEECSKDMLSKREIYYIAQLNPHYNSTDGGDGCYGHIVTEETKNVLREYGKNQWLNLTDHEKELRIKNNLRGPNVGHAVSNETKNKLRIANVGKKQSYETIQKRITTIKNKGIIRKNEYCMKQVICIETQQVFKSVKDAAIFIGVSPSSLSGHLKGRYQSTKNLHFKFCNVETIRDEFNGVGRNIELPLQVRSNL